MDSSNSNIYVAELLQQLEDLKRKKARRLQKLKKLKKPISCPQENVVKESLQNEEKKSNSGSKCVKCGLCLISKDSPCIQCISAECKENKEKGGSETAIVVLKSESGNCGNQTVPCPEVFENDNDSKSAFKHVQILPINEDKNCELTPCNVLEPVQNKIVDTKLNEKCSSTELSRKQRKRSTTAEDDIDQGEQCDHKKIKLSGDTLQENIQNIDGDIVNENSKVSSVDKLNEFDEKRNPRPIVSEDDSLFDNMSCFLSSSLLVEDEDNVKINICDRKQKEGEKNKCREHIIYLIQSNKCNHFVSSTQKL